MIYAIIGSFSAATDIETLKKQNISYILTLDICPLPVRIIELPFLTTKYIQGKCCFHQFNRFFDGSFRPFIEFVFLFVFCVLLCMNSVRHTER